MATGSRPFVEQPLVRFIPWVTVAGLLNAAYLLAAGSPTLFYAGNMVLHLVLAAVLAVLWIPLGVHVLRRESRTAPVRTLVMLVGMTLAVGAGVALLRFGSLYAHRPVVTAYIVAGLGACAMTLWWFARHGFFARRPWTFPFGRSTPPAGSEGKEAGMGGPAGHSPARSHAERGVPSHAMEVRDPRS